MYNTTTIIIAISYFAMGFIIGKTYGNYRLTKTVKKITKDVQEQLSNLAKETKVFKESVKLNIKQLKADLKRAKEKGNQNEQNN